MATCTWHGLHESPPPADRPPLTRARWVPAGEDRLGEHRSNGIAVLDFKVTAQESSGLCILEMTFHAHGGPPRHLHHAQDEWFYALEGTFLLEVGHERRTLHAGDCVFAPRQVPHGWAFVGDTRGRMLFTLAPAGQIEAFLHAITQANAMAPQDPAVFRRYDMELVGPPLTIA